MGVVPLELLLCIQYLIASSMFGGAF